MTPQGDKAEQAMGLITQLEGKVRNRNQVIEDVGLMVGVEGKAPDINVDVMNAVEDLKESRKRILGEMQEWKRKYRVLAMLGGRNPIPLIVGWIMGELMGMGVAWSVIKWRYKL